MATPKQSVAFTHPVEFFKGPDIVASPTLAAGDIKVSIAGAALQNINTLPTSAAFGADFTYSSTEMGGAYLRVQCIDQTSPKEWDDFAILINIPAENLEGLGVRVPAALVSGRMDASVGAVAAGAIVAASFGVNAIDNTVIAANAAQEIADAVTANATAAPLAANVKKINGTTVNGDGSGTPWGP